MSKDKKCQIEIPSDTDGYILLKCPLCGEKFMTLVSDIEDESLIDLWCPGCGLVCDDSCHTDEIYETVQRIGENYAIDLLNDFTKDLEKSFRGNEFVKFKTGKKIKKKPIDPILPKVEEMVLKHYLCCKKTAKIQSGRKVAGGYCPFCGEMTDGD